MEGLKPSDSEQPFYTSGQNAQFTIINGVYQPIIPMTVGCLAFGTLACGPLTLVQDYLQEGMVLDGALYAGARVPHPTHRKTAFIIPLVYDKGLCFAIQAYVCALYALAIMAAKEGRKVVFGGDCLQTWLGQRMHKQLVRLLLEQAGSSSWPRLCVSRLPGACRPGGCIGGA